jgi:hypothetical protein
MQHQMQTGALVAMNATLFRGATGRVFMLICAMHFIEYVDRGNLSIAAQSRSCTSVIVVSAWRSPHSARIRRCHRLHRQLSRAAPDVDCAAGDRHGARVLDQAGPAPRAGCRTRPWPGDRARTRGSGRNSLSALNAGRAEAVHHRPKGDKLSA